MPAQHKALQPGPYLTQNLKMIALQLFYWEPARPFQRSLGPFGPEMPKRSRKCLPGPPAPESRKVSKKSREQSGKSPESLRRVSKESFQTVPETFWRHFRDLFGISGPKGPRDLCKGRAGSQFLYQLQRLTSKIIS